MVYIVKNKNTQKSGMYNQLPLQICKTKDLSMIFKTTHIWYGIGTQALIRKLSYEVKEIGFHNNLPLTVSYSSSLRKWI